MARMLLGDWKQWAKEMWISGMMEDASGPLWTRSGGTPMNVTAAEPAGWDQGADYHRGAETMRKGDRDRQAAWKTPPARVHVATVDGAWGSPYQGSQEVQVRGAGRMHWFPPPVAVQGLWRQDS